MTDPDKDGYALNPPRVGKGNEGLLSRLFHMVILWFMLNLANTVLGVLTILQFVIMVFNDGNPNERLADFGTDLGIWVAKAIRYQTAASDVKPWPWTELD